MEGGRVSLKRSRMDFEDDESTDDDPKYNGFDDSEEEEWCMEDESKDLDGEQDIEEHEFTTSGDTAQAVKIRLFLTDEEMGDFKWMKNFVAECTCDGVVVATAFARYIHRKGMHSKFWERMEEPSEETGTGVWGSELDYGPLFLIEKLHVTALELRRKGLGQKVVSLLLEKAKQFCLDNKPDGKHADHFYGSNEAFERAWTLHALVSPGYLTADIEPQLVGKSAEERLMTRTRLQSSTIDFWRSCGFRRIGASRFFAFSFDFHHQSRALAAASDFDPRRSHAEDLENEELEVIYETDPFTEVKKLKIECLLTNAEATLLHLTACELKPLSTRWLLENVHHAESWKMARDIDGYTPLEALQEKLEKMRTRKEYGLFRVLDLSDHFKGYPDAAVSCLSLLFGRDSLVPNDACLRYGCTCGDSLIFHGEIMYDLMQEDIDDGGFWIETNDYILVHLDPDVRKNLKTNNSLRKGFVNIFRVAVECLKAKRVPTAENIGWCCNNQSEWPPNTKNYLRRAGMQMGCRAVLRYMFDAAQREDEKAGDGGCQLILKEKWSDLPTCRNDHEFEFVARACGYSGDDFISLPCW
ncbi:hypothetical protein BJX63DRAFT_419735 [Aspergillus granulosus]|uniref:N-acetyltransferase domain-containing protein n=1 Tax=Aspergillus granulosus TaxID=176169 RepID=A0ABR4HP45_9EURO